MEVDSKKEKKVEQSYAVLSKAEREVRLTVAKVKAVWPEM